VTVVVHAHLHLEAVFRRLAVRQRHDARVVHQDVQAAVLLVERRRESLHGG
jgi:hypothetical protein